MRLTAADKKFILANVTHQTPVQLSESLGKSVSLIQDFLEKAGMEDVQVVKFIGLRQTPEWSFMSEQYTKRELHYIENKYEEYCGQLDSDLEAMERKQLIQMIETDVMMQRNKRSRKRLLDQIEDIEDQLRDARDLADNNSMGALQQQLTQLNNGNSGSYRELVELQRKHDDLMQQLDATRQQRMKNAISSKHSWSDVIKSWMDKSNRNKYGKKLAIMREAYNVEKDRLSSYHEYADGEIDQPLLNADTVKDDHVL